MEKDEIYYQQYEALRLQLTLVFYKAQKGAMINIDFLNNDKSKMRLLCHHTNLMEHIIVKNQKRMEDLHKSIAQKQPVQIDVAQHLGQFLGNS